MADATATNLEQEQLIPLSGLANDYWNDGTVGYTRVTDLDNLRCSRMLLSSSSPYGIKNCPITFHVVGQLRRQDCSVTRQCAPNSVEEVASIKLCIEELPERISHVEWKQCATALDSLGMMAVLSSRLYVETKHLFETKDTGGGICLFVHGEQLKGGLEYESSEFRDLFSTHNVETVTKVGYPTLALEDLVNSFNHFRFPRTLSDISNSIACAGKFIAEDILVPGLKYLTGLSSSQTSEGTENYFPIYDSLDRCLFISSVSQLPHNVPVRATFVLDLVASELEYTTNMRARLIKLCVLA